jgi:hypothetical protein
MSLCERNNAFDEVVWDQQNKLTRVTGLDAAYSGSGGDRCVLTDLTFGPDRDGKLVIAFTCEQIIISYNVTSAAEDQIAQFVKDYHEKHGIPPGNHGFDSTGRGTLMSAYARLWSSEVVPIEFGGRPSRERKIQMGKEERTEFDAYGKQVTALWYATRIAIENEQVRNLPRECAREGSMREWTIVSKTTGRPVVDVEPKKKTKERMGRSPDLYDSFAVAFEMARIRGFQLGGQGVKQAKRRVPWWLKKNPRALCNG